MVHKRKRSKGLIHTEKKTLREDVRILTFPIRNAKLTKVIKTPKTNFLFPKPKKVKGGNKK